MTRYAFLAVASIGVAALGMGCQHSGHAEATPDNSRPQMAAAPVAAADSYTVPMVATTDTPWMNTADSASGGTLKTGEEVWIRSDASTTGVIGAKTADGRIVFVRRGDLRAK